MNVEPKVTCRLNVILTITNPYRTLFSNTILCDKPCRDADLVTKFNSVIRDSATWDKMFLNGLTVVGNHSGISQSELEAAPLILADRALGFSSWR